MSWILIAALIKLRVTYIPEISSDWTAVDKLKQHNENDISTKSVRQRAKRAGTQYGAAEASYTWLYHLYIILIHVGLPLVTYDDDYNNNK